MNEISRDSIFNTNFQILTQGKDLEKVKTFYNQAVSNLSFDENISEDLKNGIRLSILKSIHTLLHLGINPISKEIIPEYQILGNEITEVFHNLQPEKESNWMEECMAYGDKKAYYWDWKHYGSKELF